MNFHLNLMIDLSEAIDVYSEWIDACESANAWHHHQCRLFGRLPLGMCTYICGLIRYCLTEQHRGHCWASNLEKLLFIKAFHLYCGLRIPCTGCLSMEMFCSFHFCIVVDWYMPLDEIKCANKTECTIICRFWGEMLSILYGKSCFSFQPFFLHIKGI